MFTPSFLAAQTPQQPGQVPQQTPLPNTVSAPPFTESDKFDFRLVQSFGLRGFMGAAIAPLSVKPGIHPTNGAKASAASRIDMLPGSAPISHGKLSRSSSRVHCTKTRATSLPRTRA